jgi:ABC-2 type transport system ATP-binding protein
VLNVQLNSYVTVEIIDNVYAVKADGLTKIYGKTVAVDSLSLEVNEGEIFGLIGPNGSGKTTSVKMLSTLTKPSKGRASVLGYLLGKEDKKIRERIAVVQQIESYESNVTLERSLDLYGLLWNLPKKERRLKAEELLEMFDLTAYRNKVVSQLSVGIRRRLQVAREFMHDFELLFLDEPTLGLDPIARRSLLKMIKSCTEKGMSVLLTTNMLDEAEYLCNRVAILNSGKIAAIGTPEELKRTYGGFKTIELEVVFGEIVALYNALKSALDPLPVTTDQYGTVRIFTKEPSELLASVLDIAKKLSVEIGTISIKEPTLEQAFINFVESSSVVR